MDEILRDGAVWVARGVEAIATLVIAYGALEALYRVLGLRTNHEARYERGRAIFRGFAGWLVLALEFTLAGDILRTATSPSWNDIGQLAAIATIRTVLNFFLERDIERAAAQPLAKESERSLSQLRSPGSAA